jgi:DNA-binding MarR family transcriptional regulator
LVFESAWDRLARCGVSAPEQRLLQRRLRRQVEGVGGLPDHDLRHPHPPLATGTGAASRLGALEGEAQPGARRFFEYTVLSILSEQPTRTLGMSELAARTSASLSRLSNVVKRLERRGYLRRQADPDDGRCTHAILTDAGMAKVVETAPGHVAAARQFVSDAVTPTQLRQLRAANDRILRRIDPEATTRPPRVDSGQPSP